MEEKIKKELVKITTKLDKETLVIWATNCAEHVLHYFEEKYPEDDRPRKAIEAGHAWIRGEITVGKARKAALAAHASARDVEEGISQAVARAAGHAAATVHVASHAIHAANYAAKFIDNEYSWQYQHLQNLIKKKK